jgi:peroxiredoxin
MKRSTILGLLAAVTAGAFTLLLPTMGAARVEKGSAPPDFTGTTLDGKKIALAEFRGKNPVLLNFVASFAAPCRRQYQHLKGLDERLGARGLKVIAVSVDEDRAAAALLPRQLGVRFPVVLDPKEAVAQKYDVQVLPHAVVIDREGKVQAVVVGSDLEELDRAVQQVVK